MWKVTHFVPRPAEPDAWVQLVYFTIFDEAEGYFCGLNTERPHEKDEINERIENNRLEKLDYPTPIVKGQAVWLSPDRSVYIASKKNPIDDYHKIRIKIGKGPLYIFEHRKTIQERVETKREDSAGDGIELWTLNKKYVASLFYNRFAKLVVQNLERLCNAKEKPKPEGQVRWDFIPTYLYEGYFDFCYDPYFRTKSRGISTNVVQFGNIDELCFYVEATTDLSHEIRSCKKDGYSLKKTLKYLHNNTNLEEILVLGECVSSMEVISSTVGNYAIANKVNPMRDPIEMRYAIDKNHDTCVIIADIGLVRFLNEVNIDQYPTHDMEKGQLKKKNLKYIANQKTTFKMSQSYPVGFAYPLNDERWKKKIEEAFVSALKDDKITWDEKNSAGVVKELRGVGVKAWSFEELCKKYGIEETYNDSLKEKDKEMSLKK